MAERPASLDHAWPLLELLASGEPAGGEALGVALGLTRAAIWKQIDQIRKAGLPVTAAAGSGYALGSPLELLDAERIRGLLTATGGPAPPTLELMHAVTSTNRWLRDSGLVAGSVCLAEAQTEGRGRRGRSWYSPLGAGLLMSMSWRFSDLPASVGSLSLVVGLSCIRVLQRLGVEGVQLKWPNDLVHGGAKLGGILVEMRGEAHGAVELIIGIGINHQLRDQAAVPERPIVDLNAICDGSPPSRNELAAELILQLQDALPRFAGSGFAGFADAYRDNDALAGAPIQVEVGEAIVNGTHAGIADDGALLLQTESGLERIYAGEVSVRHST